MPILHYEQVVPLPLDEAFKFFADPYNLLKISPENINLRVKNKERVEMRKGAIIHYQIRWLGLPLGWETDIEEYDPPKRFIDNQRGGPYKKWHHVHTFVEEGPNTRIIDDVLYEMPFGPIGRLVEKLIVRKQIEGIFEYRRTKLDELLGKAAN